MSVGCISDAGVSYETLVDCSEEIIAGLSSEPKAMAVTLHKEGLISTDLLGEITELSETNKHNARKLYFAFSRCVQHHQHRYFDFISILRSNTLLYSDLLKVLEETYEEKEKSELISILALIAESMMYTIVSCTQLACQDQIKT